MYRIYVNIVYIIINIHLIINVFDGGTWYARLLWILLSSKQVQNIVKYRNLISSEHFSSPHSCVNPMILSKGQREVLETGKSLDGGPTTLQYQNLVDRMVKGKIAEACRELQEIHEKYPKFKPSVDYGLRWFLGSVNGDAEMARGRNGKKSSNLPDADSLESLPEWRPSEDAVDKAFKNL